MYFGRNGDEGDQIGFLGGSERAIFGRSYADEPDKLVEQLRGDEAIAEADTLLLTVPNQLGVDYNAHVIESILKHVAPALGWRCLVRHPVVRAVGAPRKIWASQLTWPGLSRPSRLGGHVASLSGATGTS